MILPLARLLVFGQQILDVLRVGAQSTAAWPCRLACNKSEWSRAESSLPRIFLVPGESVKAFSEVRSMRSLNGAGHGVKRQQDDKHDDDASRGVENCFEIFLLHDLASGESSRRDGCE